MENALRPEFGGEASLSGLKHTLQLVHRASREDVQSLHQDYSPIGLAMKCVYVLDCYDKILWDLITDLIKACHDKGIKINGGDFIDGLLERPLILAVTFGNYYWFRLLLELGASPHETDGRGRNAFCALFDERDVTTTWFSEDNAKKHEHLEIHRKRALNAWCIDMACCMWKLGRLTPCLRRSQKDPTLVYVNAQSPCGTPLLSVILHGKEQECRFLLECCGAVLTDKDFLILRALKKVERLRPMIKQFLPSRDIVDVKDCEEEERRTWIYSMHNSWSFPPTYNVAIKLTNNIGLPEDIFREHLQPFLSRDWFYTHQQLEADFVSAEIVAEFEGWHE